VKVGHEHPAVPGKLADLTIPSFLTSCPLRK
jgi:hypothetical protein